MENKGEQTFFEKIKRFFIPIVENKFQTLLAIIHYGVDAIIPFTFVFFIRSITNVFENEGIHSFYEVLIIFGGIFISLQLFFLLIRKWGWTTTYNFYNKSIENTYMKTFVLMDNNNYEKVGVGKSISIISKGIQTWSRLIDHSNQKVISLIISLVITLYFISIINTVLAYIFIIIIILGQVLGFYINSFIIIERKKRIEYTNLGGKQLNKILMSKMEILQSNKIQREIDIQGYFHNKCSECNKKMAFPLVLLLSLGHITTFILLFITFGYFGHLYFEKQISLGVLMGTSGAILLMQGVFSEALRFLKDFTKEFAQVQNLWDFFDTTPEIQGYNTGATFKHTSGNIELKNISYGYNSENPVFNKLSLTIPGSQVTAIVGVSGGGKSTLVKLISGYIRPDKGDIIIDGQKLSKVSLKSYYQDIGYLTQEPSVFDGTILENLTYALESPQPPLLKGEQKEKTKQEQEAGQPQGLPLQDNTQSTHRRGAPCGYPNDKNEFDKHLHHIIKLAKCEFIYDFPNGLHTEIGEKGIRLSGGQRQRLAIAKIFLKDPKIIILDEPTSALDSFSEEQITLAMHNLFKGRTVLIIAHRLQTVKSADDIILLEDGVVKERGTHGELVKQKGVYKKMLDLQTGF